MTLEQSERSYIHFAIVKAMFKSIAALLTTALLITLTSNPGYAAETQWDGDYDLATSGPCGDPYNLALNGETFTVSGGEIYNPWGENAVIDSEGYAVYVHDTGSSKTTIYLLFQKSEGKTILSGVWRSVRVGRFTGETGECTGEIYGERSGFALDDIFSFLSYLIPNGENGIYDLIPILSIGGIAIGIWAIIYGIRQNALRRLPKPPVEEVQQIVGRIQPQAELAPQPAPQPQPSIAPKESRWKKLWKTLFGRGGKRPVYPGKFPEAEGEVWPELHPRKVPPKGPKPKMGRSVPTGPKYEK